MIDFGFTKDITMLDKIRLFRESMIADGWVARPTYGTESIESATTLTKEHNGGAFTAMIICRDMRPHCKWNAECHINIWAPDELSVVVTQPYDFGKIVLATKQCLNCNKIVDKTFRYSFAGRCCKDCLPEMRAKHEYAGWCD